MADVTNRRCSHGAELHVGCTDIDRRGEEAVRFVFDACRYFGASLVTTHRVCALVAEEVERIASGQTTAGTVRPGPRTSDG